MCGNLTSCERDDICAETTPTTPQIVLRFFNNNMPTELLEADNLTVTALDDANMPIPISNNLAALTRDSLALPLRSDADATRFLFTLNSTDDALSNTDTLTISYTVQSVFVSRACGFSANYNAININVATDTDNWILDSAIIPGRENVTDQTSAHVQLRH